MSNKNIGVISEQGFVAGNGLGFNPLNEEDLNAIEDENSSDPKKD